MMVNFFFSIIVRPLSHTGPFPPQLTLLAYFLASFSLLLHSSDSVSPQACQAEGDLPA